jgi:hypothetical protein
MLNRDALEDDLSTSIVGVFKEKDIQKHHSRMGNTDYVTYHLPSLNPGIGVGIAEPLVLRKIRFAGETLPLTMTYALSFRISISAENLASSEYRVEYQVLNATNMDELYKQYYTETIGKDAKEIREKSSFFGYLGLLLFRRIEKQGVLIVPQLEKVTGGAAVIFFPTNREVEIKTVSYEPISWSRLF